MTAWISFEDLGRACHVVPRSAPADLSGHQPASPVEAGRVLQRYAGSPGGMRRLRDSTSRPRSARAR